MPGALIGFLLGSASFRVFSADPALLSRLRSVGIHDLSLTDAGMTFSTSLIDARRAEACLREHGTSYRAERYGLIASCGKFLARPGLVIGLLLTLCLHLVLSRLVWRIEYSGCDPVSRETASATLRSLGLYPGSFLPSIDVDDIAAGFLLRDKSAAWIHINVEGAVATVEISPRREKPPLLPPDRSAAGNVVARCDGSITRVDVYGGNAEVTEGQTVSRGDLLISPFYETRLSGTLLRQARGRVWAHTEPVFSVRIPKEKTVLSPAGNTVRRFLCLLSFRIPLNVETDAADGTLVTRRTEETTPTVFGLFSLPVTLVTETDTAFLPSRTERGREEAEKEYTANRERFLASLASSGAVVAGMQESFTEDDEWYYFSAALSCIEDIGVTEAHGDTLEGLSDFGRSLVAGNR